MKNVVLEREDCGLDLFSGETRSEEEEEDESDVPNSKGQYLLLVEDEEEKEFYCSEEEKEELQQLEQNKISSSIRKSSETLSGLVDQLHKLFEASAPESSQILNCLDKFEFKEEECKKALYFNTNRYTRTLIELNEKFSLFLLCWEPGQATPIHTHSNSVSWLKVVKGELELIFYNSNKLQIRNSKLPFGSCYFCHDTVNLHKMLNSSSNKSISFHIYSPPYVECSSEENAVPIVYCNLLSNEKQVCKELEISLQSQIGVFSNFRILNSVLSKEFSNMQNSELAKRIQKVIRSFQLNPKEWLQYIKSEEGFTKSLVSNNKYFTLEICCWNPNTNYQFHIKNTNCWIKVLEGELTINIKKNQKDIILVDGVTYLNENGNYFLENFISGRTITLNCSVSSPERFEIIPISPIFFPIGASIVGFSNLIQSLDKEFEKEKFSIESIKQILHFFQFSQAELSIYANFDVHRYSRNLLEFNSKYSLLLLCWSPRQLTPLHDHNHSASFVKIISGELKKVHFFENDKKRKQRLNTERIYYFDENTGSHITSNGEFPSISLHLYTPPYLGCMNKSKENECAPIIYCSSGGYHEYNSSDEHLTIERLIQSQNLVFSNLKNFVRVLKKEIQTDKNTCSEQIKRVLETFQFNPREWSQYVHFDEHHYTRNLIAYDEQFIVILACWNKGQSSTIHDHSGSCGWMKILQGSVNEAKYEINEAPQLIGFNSLGTDSVTFNNEKVIHKIENQSLEIPAVSLHIYSPPFENCNCFDPNTTVTMRIEMNNLPLV